MTTIQNVTKGLKAIAMSAAIVLTMAQCSEEEIVAEQTVTEDMTTAIASESADVASISVTGLFTEITGDVECATCTYIVTPGETTVDGKELGFKPGSVICLKKGLKYSSIDFVNMEGTAENPITIGYCSK